MDSNISFKSNVFPVNGSISSDSEFLSKIWDYNRIDHINSRFHPLWQRTQRTILKEKPYCALNREDPCWGMVGHGNDARWVCMCTKTTCPQFSQCRSEIPFDRETEQAFIPTGTTADIDEEYAYKKETGHTLNPVLIGDYFDYLAPETTKQSAGSAQKIRTPSTFGTLLKASGKTSAEQTQSTTSPDMPPVIPNYPEKPITNIEPVSTPTVSKEQLLQKDLNIFDSFIECKQEDIIRADPHSSHFVDAGPGTGKTYTLIQKLNYMVTEKQIDPEGILVLCFTNAAVDEIKSRLKLFIQNGADRSLANIDVRTFHSFAWWLIGQANEEFASSGWNRVDMMSLSYETSLEKAGEVISKYGNEVVSSWEHFVVDEVQDLTNTLGYFVLRIINACVNSGCGITVLGDACQAIYDYAQETEHPLNSTEFYRSLFRKLYGKARFVFLTENHRQGSTLISLTSSLRNAILSGDNDQLKTAVRGFMESVAKLDIPASSISEAVLDRERNGGSISMLLRNNGQTLKLSSDLRKRGVAHYLNISETRNNYATWIADVFGDYSKATISEDVFCARYERATGEIASDAWSRLQRLMHTNNDVLGVRNLLNAIAISKIDDPILRTVASKNTIVSNIHRSKGREYDCVVVDKAYAESLLSDSSPDEYRTLYVAITRPKQKLLLAPLQNKTSMQLISIFSTGRKRWGKAKGGRIAYLEFDSSKDIIPDLFAYTDANAFACVSIGDEIRLQRQIRGHEVHYAIIHEATDTFLGIIGNTYIQDLKGYMKIDETRLIELPAIINDIYVSGIYSQVVPSEYLEQHPEVKSAAPNGVWKWIDLVGVGHADYDVY